MELPALFPSPLPPAVDLSVAALLWVFATLFTLAAARTETGQRRADRLRLGATAAAVGLAQWAALLALMTALTGASAAHAHPVPLFAALAVLPPAASLSMRLGLARRPWLAVEGVLAASAGVGLAILLLTVAVAVDWPPAPLLAALGLSVLAGQGALARTLRELARARGPAPWRVCLLKTAGVALVAFTPITVSLVLMPVVVPRSASTGAPLVIGVLAAAALAIAGASVAIDRLGGRGRRLLPARLGSEDAAAAALAQTDALTGLPSRTAFTTWLTRAGAAAVRRKAEMAVLVIGIDGFKKINDAYGPRCGDAVLAELARRLGAACGSLSTPSVFSAGPLARTGGDEFTLVLSGRPTRDAAAEVAAKVLALLAQRVAVDGSEVELAASIGVACGPGDGVATTLLAHGEVALRAAKSNGGATYALFEPRLIDEASDRVDLLRDLRRAVSEGQLELLYQPKIDARSGQVTAAEALLRWRHPGRGLISPGVFIPLAERYGLIRDIGGWVIEDACRQARKWRRAGLKMRVAINLSATQMRQEDLVDRILAALRRNGVDPSRLTCEITETVAMEDTQVTQRTFARLGEAGIHLSIDDFGTGYSSLAYLRQLPAAELKIDRAFVKDLHSNADARSIVAAVVKMAHAIGLRVVAEGVENVAQRDVLLGVGCDELQGYLFAKPMSARALLLWAVQDRPAQRAFRPSLYADTNTPTQVATVLRTPA